MTTKSRNVIPEQGIYRGTIRHRRFTPTKHEFQYNFSMLFFDLEKAEEIFSVPGVTGTDRWRLGLFKRSDYAGNNNSVLKHWVLDQVEQKSGSRPDGAVMLLTNLRILGWIMNPIVMFYCYDQQGLLRNIVLQVTNTPWRNKVIYVLGENNVETSTTRADRNLTFRFKKDMHVSPYNAMHMTYLCRLQPPGNTLFFHLENHLDDQRHTDATLTLKRNRLTKRTAALSVSLQPWLTVKVATGIYWNALKLFFKRTPIYDHPGDSEPAEAVSPSTAPIDRNAA